MRKERGATRARRDLISRTARVWSRLGRSIIKERGAEVEAWSSRLMASAEDAVMKGTDIDAPPFPPTWGDALRDDLLYAMAQGFWLQHVYMQEARAERQGKRYRVPQDDPTKAALEALTKRKVTLADSDDWHKVIPKDAIDWIEGYTPKLAGTLEKDVLERVKREVQGSLAKGTSVRERVKALREASPKVAAMSKARVEAIARTEVTRADTMGRLLSMKRDEDVIGVEFSAVLDSRTTPGCERRHGLVMRLDDPRLPENAPPRHVNCRSMLLPVSTWDAPDGLFTSHEFDDVDMPRGGQRPEDVEAVRAVLGMPDVEARRAARSSLDDASLMSRIYDRRAEEEALSQSWDDLDREMRVAAQAGDIDRYRALVRDQRDVWQKLDIVRDDLDRLMLQAGDAAPDDLKQGKLRPDKPLVAEPGGPPIAKSIEEAAKIARGHGIARRAELADLALRACNELIQSVHKNKMLFPEIETFGMIGSCQTFERERASLLAGARVRSVSPDTFAFVPRDRDLGGALEKLKGVYLNSVWCSPERITKTPSVLSRKVAERFYPVGCDTIKSMIDHEMGHVIDGILRASSDPGLRTLYLTSRRTMKDELSGYAGKNIREFIAEGWREYLNNPVPRPMAKRIGERILEMAATRRQRKGG